MPSVTDAAPIEELQRRRLRLHRLAPSRPIRDVRSALAFIADRRIVLATGHSSLPCLAESISGRALVGSWMAEEAVVKAEVLANKIDENTTITKQGTENIAKKLNG
ncbi:MAG TPA: hypothetical protein VNA31_01810, partial [bacterium]|nr:hypothetical protein [bacterium]